MEVGHIAPHSLHDLLAGALQQLRHGLLQVLRIPEIIGAEQGSGQAVPPAVGPSAVDGGADHVLLGGEQADAVVVGPGLGTDNRSKEVLEVTLSNISDNQFCIIDGSAITLISENDFLKELIANNKKIIFTPHQMEW